MDPADSNVGDFAFFFIIAKTTVGGGTETPDIVTAGTSSYVLVFGISSKVSLEVDASSVIKKINKIC
jgi:hypothetical protein